MYLSIYLTSLRKIASISDVAKGKGERGHMPQAPPLGGAKLSFMEKNLDRPFAIKNKMIIIIIIIIIKKGNFKCTYAPCFVIPHGLSTLYRCSLTNVAQDKPYHEKLFIRDCFNHKGSCTLFRPYLTIAAGISSSSFVQVSTRQLAVSSLLKGISSTLNFHESIGTDGTRTRNLTHPK